jgi:hypothetical protein
MTAAQLVTPTNSQLATVNAIQAAVTASANWSVNATGTSSIGAKWVEIRPSNVNSLYKDYRVLIVERVNTSTNKGAIAVTGDGFAWNSTTNIYFRFVPDGGSAHVTFNAANIETANDVYAGTRYNKTGNTAGQWVGMQMPCTALWLYLCDGALWLVNRLSPTSHILLSIGHIMTLTGFSDFNTAGTEMGLPAIRKSTSLTSGTMWNQIANTHAWTAWYGSGTANRTIYEKLATDSIGTAAFLTQGSSSGNVLEGFNIGTGVLRTMNFPPVAYWSGTSSAPGTVVLRGVYLGLNQKTRTTIQSNSVTAGYTFYPDDSASGVQLATLAFLNT